MKRFYFLTLLVSLAYQLGLIAQTHNSNAPQHQLDVQIQNVPANPEKNDQNSNNQQRPIENGNGVIKAQPANEARSERTLSILKPDALKNRHIGDIISKFEKNGLLVVGIKMTQLSPEQAGKFYNVHRDRPFFNDLVKFMSSAPVVILVLEGDQAISKNRTLMGATDPKKAEKGTIRAEYAQSTTENAVHGSDSPESAREEILFFFSPQEIYPGK